MPAAERAGHLASLPLRDLMELASVLMRNQRMCEQPMRLDVLTALTLRMAKDVSAP
jgi:hypothetical protein